MERVRLIADNKDILGESPIWDPNDNILYWVDTEKYNIYSYDYAEKKVTTYKIDRPVVALGKSTHNNWILVTKEGLFFWEKGKSKTKMITPLLSKKENVRFNDGVADPLGRYLVGDYNTKELDRPDGSIYSIGLDGKAKTLDTGLVIPNGMTFSRDGKTFYVAEQLKSRILAYDYDLRTGKISNRRIFAEVPKEYGLPDGLITEIDGYLWSAHWQGWRITRYDNNGRVDKVIEVPFTTPTCLAFGGPLMDELFITSATFGLSEEQLKKSNKPGGLFSIKTDYTGVYDYIFKWNK
jgi:sugar lactone lactonase YvrE